MSDDLELVRGDGNVFADLGDANAATKHLKAQLAAQIIGTLNSKALTVRAAGKLTGMDPADIQRIRSADLSRFTVDRLIRVAVRLGCRVSMKVTSTAGTPRRPASPQDAARKAG
jgi:predicted XRE-type DNA-binding protein